MSRQSRSNGFGVRPGRYGCKAKGQRESCMRGNVLLGVHVYRVSREVSSALPLSQSVFGSAPVTPPTLHCHDPKCNCGEPEILWAASPSSLPSLCPRNSYQQRKKKERERKSRQ